MNERKRYRTKWMSWTWAVLALACACAAVAVRGGAVEWFLLVLLAGVMIVSGLLPHLAINSISAHRVVSEADAGGESTIRLSIARGWRMPFVWTAIEDEARNGSGLKEEAIVFRAVAVPLLSKEINVNYSLKALTRGLYHFQTITVTCGDMLGMTAIRREFVVQSELVVKPSLPEGEYAADAGNSDSEAILFRSDTGGGLTERSEPGLNGLFAAKGIAGLGPDSRPYRDGDSLRNMDFRAAARGRGWHTKLRSFDSFGEVHIVIDQFADPYNGNNRLFDGCISWALFAALRGAEEGCIVKVHADEWSYELSGFSGKGLGARIDELKVMLAYIRPSGERTGRVEFREEEAGPRAGRALWMFTADWQDASRWLKLAETVKSDGFALKLYFFTSSGVPSFGMREQSRLLDNAGVAVSWLQVGQLKEAGAPASATVEEGGHSYAMG